MTGIQSNIYILENLNEDLYDALQQKTEELFSSTVEAILKGEPLGVNESNDNSFRVVISRMGLNNDVNLQKAYYLGIWKTLNEVQKKVYDEQIKEFTGKDVLTKYKHLKNLVNCLYHSGLLSHSELAECLNITVSALTNFLKRIENQNYYRVQKVGKQKLYTITNKGQWLYRVLCNNENENLKLEDFSDFLINLLKSISNELKEENPEVDRIFLNSCKENYKNPYHSKPKTIKKEIQCILNNVQKHNVRRSTFSATIKEYLLIHNERYTETKDAFNRSFQIDEENNFQQLLEVTRKRYNTTVYVKRENYINDRLLTLNVCPTKFCEVLLYEE